MHELRIACGKSCYTKVWDNCSVTWEELCNRLKSTARTYETVEEYKVMNRDARSSVKDRGGFVGGHLKDGRRKIDHVECRSMITLDADHAEPGFINRFARECKYAAVIYTTHSHTPDAPRARIIVPLEREITPERYAAVSRYFASLWGIDQFDECSYKVNQLMYWPTTSSDGEYICRITKGSFLDADAFLANYPGWNDCTTLPKSSRETEIKINSGKKQEDPLSKEGIVGAFCRTYTIEDAIEKFLSDVYEPAAVDGRYSYIQGEGTAGVILYDDCFAYSHHATDPACGKLLNAFDLVRIHLFSEDNENDSFMKMCRFAEEDEETKETLKSERIEEAQEEFETINSTWEEPLPFVKHNVVPFPIDALPEGIREYVAALSESLQTPIDMAGCAVLSVIATCIQGKYVIQGKADWSEPLNIYITEIAPPSERKSSIQHAIVKPLSAYENNYNIMNAASVEASRMRTRILNRKQKAVEENFSKEKATQEDVDRISNEIAEHHEKKPLRLFADDITPEKLVSILSENNGRMALLSSEAGIFDTLAGAYSKAVNIDVMLKGYSGDMILVDRIGRDSASVLHPTLTFLLMAQPSVISTVLSNDNFRGRGLTARFLYSMPKSFVGERQYRSDPVPDSLYEAYERRIVNMLEDFEKESPEVITLSPKADVLLERFAQDLEPKLVREYAEIADWCGKLVGNVLRIAGLLCRAGVNRSYEFLKDDPEPLVVSEQTMKDAIRLGEYFLNHAQTVFNTMPENTLLKNAERVLKMLREKGLKEFNRRTAMRYCQTFKKVEDIQPVLDFLEEYGYIASIDSGQAFGKGRPPMPKYLVNPLA